MSKIALLLIDLQNDYFPNGKFPLWNTEVILAETKKVIVKANNVGVPIIFIQHIADNGLGTAAFFNAGTQGAAIHPQILAAAPNAQVLVKNHADSFYETNLEDVLDELGVDSLWIAGMMTQNCVTFTAISQMAEKYDVSVLPDLCSTVDEMINNIALRALSTRVKLISSAQLLV